MQKRPVRPVQPMQRPPDIGAHVGVAHKHVQKIHAFFQGSRNHVADEGLIESSAGELLRYRRAIGADHVINYREERFEGAVRKITGKKGVDVVFEHVGPDTWAGSLISLKRIYYRK